MGIAIVFGVWVLAGYGVISIWWTIIITLGAALLGAWQLDRTGRGRRALSHMDENKPHFYAPRENVTWQVPTAYIDHPTGGGPPPGTESYDPDYVGSLVGEDETLGRDRDDQDPAP